MTTPIENLQQSIALKIAIALKSHIPDLMAENISVSERSVLADPSSDLQARLVHEGAGLMRIVHAMAQFDMARGLAEQSRATKKETQIEFNFELPEGTEAALRDCFADLIGPGVTFSKGYVGIPAPMTTVNRHTNSAHLAIQFGRNLLDANTNAPLIEG